MPWVTTMLAATWPLSAIVKLAVPSLRKTPEDIKAAGGAAIAFKGKGVADTLEDHVSVFTGTFPKLVFAHFVWASLAWSLDGGARFATLDRAWIVPIVVRDLLITFATAWFCDFLAYNPSSGFAFKTLADYKFDAGYYADKRPETLLGVFKTTQMVHDMFWSLLSTVISSGFEVAALHAWATGRLAISAPMDAPYWRDAATLAWLLTMPYWRLAHFYSVHRFMHKWFTRESRYWIVRQIPDVGQWMYLSVHALHHKSKSPTAWSGVSMHPVESTLYYTAMLIPLFLGAHPIVLLYTKLDLTMAALIGHDGFGSPGGGSQPHWVHHKMINVNYGENYAPFDYFFGTFAATEEDAAKIIEARSVVPAKTE